MMRNKTNNYTILYEFYEVLS